MKNEPVAWIAYDEFGDFMLEATPEGDYPWQPLYTHPHPDNLGFALSIIDQQKLEISELKQYTKKGNGLLAECNEHMGKLQALILKQDARITELEKDLKYFTNPCHPMCKPSICDCYKARFAINNRKTLTDEEIYQLAEYHGINDWLYETSVTDFAKAILKKASEK